MLVFVFGGIVPLKASEDLTRRINTLYENVFADPSNISLNIELVRSQIQLQDYKGASGTLERLLILAPENRSAQLLMAQVKIGLGNYQEAKYLLLKIIAADDAEIATKQRAEEMLLSVNTLIDGFSWQASVEINGGVSQNPENKPDKTSYSLLLPSSPIEVSGAAQEFAGGSISGVFEKSFNNYDRTTLRVSVGHQRRDYMTYDKSDYEVYDASVTLIKGDQKPIESGLSLMRVVVRERDFMDQIGIQGKTVFNAPYGVALIARGYVGRQTHRNHINFSNNTDKTGNLAKLGLAGMMMLGPSLIRTGLDFDRKHAQLAKHSYHQTKLKFDTNIPLYGLNILSKLSLMDKRYDAAEMVYADHRRRDRVVNLGFEVQLPINQFLPKGYHDFRFSFSGDVNRTYSNIDRFDSTKSEIMFKANYAFGGR